MAQDIYEIEDSKDYLGNWMIFHDLERKIDHFCNYPKLIQSKYANLIHFQFFYKFLKKLKKKNKLNKGVNE